MKTRVLYLDYMVDYICIYNWITTNNEIWSLINVAKSKGGLVIDFAKVKRVFSPLIVDSVGSCCRERENLLLSWVLNRKRFSLSIYKSLLKMFLNTPVRSGTLTFKIIWVKTSKGLKLANVLRRGRIVLPSSSHTKKPWPLALLIPPPPFTQRATWNSDFIFL